METSTTLADTLLDDLADLSDVEEEKDHGDEEERTDSTKGIKQQQEEDAIIGDHNGDDADGETKKFPSENADTNNGIKKKWTSVLESRFLDNVGLQRHLRRIRNMFKTDNDSNNDQTGDSEARNKIVHNADQKEEDDSMGVKVDYELIVESNRLRNRLSEEMQRIHDVLCQVYGQKFPELEELVSSSPLLYKTAVQVIQNEMDLTKVNEALNQQFHSNSIITMSVASSVTQGRPLTEQELQFALQLASYMDEIHRVELELTRFVEQRMRGLAPSLCALIGPQVTAQMVGLAGGLSELALIPACNLQVMGQVKSTAASRAGLSSTAMLKSSAAKTTAAAPQYAREGILAQCDLFVAPSNNNNSSSSSNNTNNKTSNTSSTTTSSNSRLTMVPPQYRTKLLKQVAAKVALCARCDAINVEQGRPRTSAPGEKYRQEILTKLDRWQHPQDSAPVTKALPKSLLGIVEKTELCLIKFFMQKREKRMRPDLTVKKRRGGKRIRRLKERFEETAMMKQANTRSFSAAAGEYGDDAMGISLGLLDTEGGGMDGSVRKNSNIGEKRPMRLANTKAARKQRALASKISQQHLQQEQQVSTGLASTVAFTPLQAMELVNPDAQREKMVREANKKWFADNAGFQSALPPKHK